MAPGWAADSAARLMASEVEQTVSRQLAARCRTLSDDVAFFLFNLNQSRHFTLARLSSQQGRCSLFSVLPWSQIDLSVCLAAVKGKFPEWST